MAQTPEGVKNYTFYVYEELPALIKAVQRSGYGLRGMEQILYCNGARLLGGSIVGGVPGYDAAVKVGGMNE
ncbi:MAG: hypothetical protein HYX78_12750 [Armatimonadetes bacterium]|nr:hypothetical protein [Armatimonadota bacterium]